MKNLKLSLKYKWYDMIERGEKTSEYRVMSPWWMRNLLSCTSECEKSGCDTPNVCLSSCKDMKDNLVPYETVTFSRGYTLQTMTFVCKKIEFGKHVFEGDTEERDCFIIQLGERIS